jgi:hypothetical protein
VSATLLHEGHPVPITAFGEQKLVMPRVVGGVSMRRLAQGEEDRRTMLVSRLYDVSMPGRYVLEASKSALRRSGIGRMRVVSNRITIDVVDD